MATPSPNSYVFTPGATLYAGMATPSGGTTLTTITLANTSATEQSAGFVSPMFGLPLKQGDVPAGQYPAFFLADNTPVPATIHSVTSWPDGSMKWCGVFLRVPTTVAGSGTLSITVKNGGSAPVSSSRALSDFTAANLSVELTGVTNLSGVWAATLNDAITNGTAVVIADGPAGAIWRVLGDFKQSGSAHGQMVCWHYVAALQNTSGGLLGIRYLGRVAQPWADVASPTPTRRVVNAVLKSGASTLRTLQGHDTTETVGANIGMAHYTSFFTAGTDGRWDFVQGGGSGSADCTVRVQHDKTYFVKPRLVEPYDTSLSPTSNASVDYSAYCLGSFQQRDLNSTGPSNFIGLIPEWCATHLLTQAAVDERCMRVSALASGGFRTCVRNSSTKEVIPVVDVQASYTGMGAIQTTWQYGDGYFAGVQTPAVTTSLWVGDTDTSHRPSTAYYPYLVTGEPQYLDLVKECASQAIMSTQAGLYERNVTTPISSLAVGTPSGRRNIKVGASTYKGAGLLFFGNQVRTSAWASRDVAHGAALIPDSYESAVRSYFLDALNQSYQAWNAVNAAMPTSWRDGGLISLASNTWTAASNDTLYESPWMTMYLSLSLCHQSQILGNSNVPTLRAHVSKFISSAHAQMDVAALASYRWKQWDGSGNLVTSISDALFYNPCTLTFSTSTSRATVGGTLGTWTPTNGDMVALSTNLDADKPFAAATNEKVFYVVNASGNTFQLSETLGGPAISVTSAVSVSPVFLQLQNASPLNAFSTGGTELALVRGAARFHEACGDSAVASARAALDTRLAASGWSFTTDPRFAYAPSYPA